MSQRRRPSTRPRDEGTVMPLVLIITIVLAVVVVSMANYSTTNLKYGRVAEDRSDRLAAADAGMRYALDQIKLKARGCVWDDAKHNLPGIASDFNGATAEVSCQRITTGLDDIKLYAAVMTGEGATLAGDNYLLSSQGGSNTKVLGGPVYMQRIDSTAFYFDSSATHAGVEIEDGPLLYHDPTPQCTPEKPSVVIARAQGKLKFTPDLIFGPECVNQSWQQKFPSPPIPTNLKTGLPVRSGTNQISLDLVNPYTAPYNDPTVTTTLLQTLNAILLSPTSAGFVDFSGGGGCRVFFPGRYTSSPATSNRNVYFLSGDYVFDLPNSNAKLVARSGVLTAGVPNPKVFRPSEVVGNERANTTACNHIQSLDPANADPENLGGATFYFANNSFIEVETNGALEIHGRKQGDNFVSVQTLCKVGSSTWCLADGNGGFSPSDLKWSTLNATSTEEILYTDSGNGKEFVAHGLFYAPLAEAEFGNVSNSAIQKMRGGIVVSQLILQAATSATNFEIAVPTSPIIGKVEVTSTAVKNGAATAIRAIIEYRPYEVNVDDRIAVNSWRVCEGGTC